MFEHAAEYESESASVRSIAEMVGSSPETLRIWVRQAERDTGRRPILTSEDRRRLKELERENEVVAALQ